MRRLIMVMCVAALAALVTGSAHATEPSKTCSDTSTPVSVDQTQSGARACLNDGVVDGSATASAEQATPGKGYVVADGNSTNPGALGGYIGVENGNASDPADPAIVGCSSGNYAPTGANHVALSLSNPQPPDPADPCLPQPPAA